MDVRTRAKKAATFLLTAMSCTVTLAFPQGESRRPITVRAASATLAVTTRGQGEPIVFIPSRGRSVDDFDNLSERVAIAGYLAILPEPRGIGGSAGPLEGITYHDLASDIAATIQSVAKRPATVVGHDFGGRIARMVAADHPDLVKELVLIGAAGKVRRSPEMESLTTRFWEGGLSIEDRLNVLSQTFFARGNNARVWEGGWHFDVARAQRAGDSRTPLDEWWAGGNVPMLVIYGAEDKIAVPANAKSLAAEFPDRVTLVEIPKAGHALLPEQPEHVADAVVAYLRRNKGHAK